MLLVQICNINVHSSPSEWSFKVGNRQPCENKIWRSNVRNEFSCTENLPENCARDVQNAYKNASFLTHYLQTIHTSIKFRIAFFPSHHS